MARITATAAKAAAATAAVDLTTILQDDTLEELFLDYKNAQHPIRKFENFFLVDAATGVVTSNDDYIDNAYAGDYPTSGIESGRQDAGVPSPLLVVSATLETAQPRDIVITFNQKIFANPQTAMTIAGAGVGAKTIVSVTISTSGLVMTIVVSADFINTDVVTVSGRVFGNHNNYLDLTAEAVTNNI